LNAIPKISLGLLHVPPTHQAFPSHTQIYLIILLLLTFHKMTSFADSLTHKVVWKCCGTVLNPDLKDKNHCATRNTAAFVVVNTYSLLLTLCFLPTASWNFSGLSTK